MNATEPKSLTPRRAEALQLCAAGKSARATAEIMGVSVETVKVHLKDTRHRLGVRNTTHAVAIAIRRGFITAEAT